MCRFLFFASAGASSAYLTVSEIFPLEVRGQAISYFFFSIAQIAGAIAPFIFGNLIGDGSSRGPLVGGYFIGAGIMLTGDLVALFMGVDAEGKVWRPSLIRSAVTVPRSPPPVKRSEPGGDDYDGQHYQAHSVVRCWDLRHQTQCAVPGGCHATSGVHGT